MAMPRFALAALFLCCAALATACFGDNSIGTSLQLSGPDELDGGDTATLTIEVQGPPNLDLELTLESASGTFSTPNQVVAATDASGKGVFSTLYTADNKAAVAIISVTYLDGDDKPVTLTKSITIHELEKVGNVEPILDTVIETSYLTAYPLQLAASATLLKLAIVAPEPADALVGLYSNTLSIDGDAPGMALARVHVALTEGVNELAVPPLPLGPGIYWMLVTYDGPTETARGGDTIVGRSISGYLFRPELPAIAPQLQRSDNMGLRNFYLVLRK